ncbi:sterol desaturase family protein, partial [Pelagibacteraceae bacterium]|nr:sterol desaturase family protein [Pelagibacteraceae bacterium]
PLIHELGFYFTHRLLHFKFLYKIAHRIHHKNINPGPWSGLSMHPIEHLIYFGIILILLLFPTHPLHALNLLIRLGISPAEGHSGFDRIVIKKNKSFNASFYAHYLHHKYFEVNYADGIFPLDKLFGTFHDGTVEGDKIFRERRKILD